jgi:hypothetical protein
MTDSACINTIFDGPDDMHDLLTTRLRLANPSRAEPAVVRDLCPSYITTRPVRGACISRRRCSLVVSRWL